MKKVVLILALLLIGCANKEPLVIPGDVSKEGAKSPATDKPIEQSKPTIEIDAYLLQECEEFSMMVSKNPTPKDILDQKAKDVAVRNACAGRHRSLVKIVKDAFNVQEK